MRAARTLEWYPRRVSRRRREDTSTWIRRAFPGRRRLTALSLRSCRRVKSIYPLFSLPARRGNSPLLQRAMDEPTSSDLCHTLQGTRFFEQMRAAGNDFELHFAAHLGARLLV